MRIETNVMPRIKSLCESLRVDENEILIKARLLISLYHEIVWGSLKNGNPGTAGTNEKKYAEAVTYLSVFPSTVEKKELQHNLLNIFQAEWYEELLMGALNYVSLYKHNSVLYTRILNECYFLERTCSDKELYGSLIIERSSYFKRKKEAILLFGVALWGIAIPKRINQSCAVDPHSAFLKLIDETGELS